MRSRTELETVGGTITVVYLTNFVVVEIIIWVSGPDSELCFVMLVKIAILASDPHSKLRLATVDYLYVFM